MPRSLATWRYRPSPAGLWVVACFFNPSDYRSKLDNFRIFAEALQSSGIPLLVVECTFPGQSFAIHQGSQIVRVRARDVMWQKERLLNIGISRLPADCGKVAWLDGDLIFENPNWAVEAARLLDDYPVIQLFSEVIRLPQGAMTPDDGGECWNSFAAVHTRSPRLATLGDFRRHGHTGFAWAARRDWLSRHGLYDACIAGSADHMMAHAFCGDWTGPCLDRIIGDNNPHRRHFECWSQAVHAETNGRIACVDGSVYHLWHGETSQRRCVDRNRELAAFGFDPERDLRLNADGCWEWNAGHPELQRWAVDYFRSRQEDGLNVPAWEVQNA